MRKAYNHFLIAADDGGEPIQPSLFVFDILFEPVIFNLESTLSGERRRAGDSRKSQRNKFASGNVLSKNREFFILAG
jgi:hypothetical protein